MGLLLRLVVSGFDGGERMTDVSGWFSACIHFGVSCIS
jgi:hypothetical protein